MKFTIIVFTFKSANHNPTTLKNDYFNIPIMFGLIFAFFRNVGNSIYF